MSRPSGHPEETVLALLAGGDLPLLERWRVAAHVRRCGECAAVVAGYRALRAETARWSGELAQEGLDEETWARLESEMRANIRLGLAAGAAVGPDRVRLPQPAGSWRLAAVAASMVFVLGAGAWLSRQHGSANPVAVAAAVQPVVEAGRQGLALRRTGAALELMRPEGSESVRTVSWDGTARARYFDGETGQVTIHQVAWEESDAQ